MPWVLNGPEWSKAVINPYHFVPFGDGPKRNRLNNYFSSPAQLLSGWIDVDVYLKTPLIIPTNFTGPKDGHRTGEFFRLPDTSRPAIPGSELRGMLRSVFEAASDSCLPFLKKDQTDEQAITWKLPAFAAFKDRALLEYRKDLNLWQLRKAKAYRIKVRKTAVGEGTFYGLKTGDFVPFYTELNSQNEVRYVEAIQDKDGNRKLLYVDPIDNSKTLLPCPMRAHQEITELETPKRNKVEVCKHEGYIQFNVPIDGGQDYYIRLLVPEEEVLFQWKEDDDSPYHTLCTTIKETLEKEKLARSTQKVDEKQSVTTQEALLTALKKAKENGGIVPVFYKELKEQSGQAVFYYLSAASVGRVQQRRTWKEIMGMHAPCKKLSALCPACALFGTLAENDSAPEEPGCSGRVRVTDAVDVTEPKPERRGGSAVTGLTLTTRTLPILAEPQPTAFEFYYRKPVDEAAYWTCDYYTVSVSGNNGRKRSDLWQIKNPSPRGRKFYWHFKPSTVNAEKGKMNATVEFADYDGSRPAFRFQIYYDRITEDQLKQLLWTIHLGENQKESQHQHKLGHGKPLGYGSVKLVVTGVSKRVVKKGQDGLTMQIEPAKELLHASLKWPFAKNDAIQNALLRLCDAKAVGENRVAYPTGVTNSGTKEIYEWFSQNRANAGYVLALREATDPDLTLPDQRKSGKYERV